MYWWLSLIIVLLYAAETALIVLMRNNRKATLLLVFIVSVVWFIYQSCEYIAFNIKGNGLYPVEFSHMTYFILGATMLAGVKKMRGFASYCAMLTGLGFLIASIASPGSMVHDAKSHFSLAISILRHALMWLCGFGLFFSTERFHVKDIWIPVLGIALMIGFSLLVHYRLIYKDFVKWDDMVIIKIVKGTILGYIIDPSRLTMPVRVFTVIGIFAAVAASRVLFYYANAKIYDRRLARLTAQGKTVSDVEYGIVPFIKRQMEKKRGDNPDNA